MLETRLKTWSQGTPTCSATSAHKTEGTCDNTHCPCHSSVVGPSQETGPPFTGREAAPTYVSTGGRSGEKCV